MLLEARAYVDTRRRLKMQPTRQDFRDTEGNGEGYIEIEAMRVFGDEANIDESVDAEEEPHSEGLTPLMFAAQEGHLKVVELLLQMRASPNAQDEDGMAPIHFAAESRCSESCRTLLAARALPEVKDLAGRDAVACLPTAMSRSDRQQWISLLRPKPHV